MKDYQDIAFVQGQLYAMQDVMIQAVVTRNVIMELWATQKIADLNKQLELINNVSPLSPMTEAGSE